MTSIAAAPNGAFMHIATETPHVHCLTTPTHARRRAWHPLAGGRLGKQTRRAHHLGKLVSSSRKHMRIFEDRGRRLAGILTRHQSLNADVHTHSRIFYAERIQGLQDEDSPVRQTCYSHSVSRLGRCLCGKAGPFWIL